MTRWARVTSALGHPLLTMSAFMLFISYRSAAISLGASLFVIAAVIVPLGLWNFFNARAGAYSNFDVSTRTERHSMYWVVIALLVLASIGLYVSGAAFSLRAGMVGMLILFGIGAAANYVSKVSLHAAISFYLAVVMLAIDRRGGFILLSCAMLVAISRFVLRRHTAAELVWGGLLGVAVGAGFVALTR